MYSPAKTHSQRSSINPSAPAGDHIGRNSGEEAVRVGELMDGTQRIQAEIDALGSAVQKLESQLAPVLSQFGGAADNHADPQPECRSSAGAALYRQADMVREIFKAVSNLSQRLEV